MTRPVSALATVFLLLAATASADVVRIEVDARHDVADSRAYGLAGPYEALSGMVHFEVDPANPANRVVTDIDLAPRNDRGMVEFRSNFYLLKPADAARGNGTVLYEVSNRGGKGMLGYFNNAAGSRYPRSAEEMGDGFLLENGFSLLWLGWQFDVPVREGQMRLHTPVATDDGATITGLVRSEVVVNERTFDRSLADRSHIAYEVADPDDPANVMTVRNGAGQPRRVVPRDQWRFARREAGGEVVADPTRVYLEGGFEPHKLYDIVYVAKDPALVGLGPAAVRDMISRMKYGESPELRLTAGSIDHAIAWGVSQSGRFLRTFLYHGYNRDEQDRRAFDGIMSHVAGGGRGSFNHRFAQPSRDGHPFLNKLYPSDIFPFTDIAQHDPETDIQDGLLSAIQPGHMPKVFYTNSSYEYWGRAASLIHTTIDGASDAPLMDNVRIYSFAGGQHGPGRFPPRRTSGQQPSNPNDYSWFLRPLVLAMNGWVGDETALPPASVYPRIADGDLVAWDAVGFPELPGVGQPAEPHLAYRAVYGPEFRDAGHRDRAAPRGAVGVPDPRARGRRRRQRDGRADDAGSRGAAGHLHRMEPVPCGGGADRRAVEHAGVLHPVPADGRGPGSPRRLAALDRGAVRQPRRLSRPRDGGGAGPRRSGLPAGRRSGADPRPGGAPLGLPDGGGHRRRSAVSR